MRRRERVIVASFILSCFLSPAASASVWHVDGDAPPGGGGTAWSTAFRFLQDALAVAQAGDEIRIAEGTYRPDERSDWTPGGTGDRTATFQLISGVAIYGGYAGYGEPDPDARNLAAQASVLSGDLAEDDGPAPFDHNDENAYHVVNGSGTDATAVLDGVTVTRGHANGSHSDRFRGAGMYNAAGSPTVSRCTFVENEAGFGSGGGMYNDQSALAVVNCYFGGNSAYFDGGAVYSAGGAPALTNCAFAGNIGDEGGAIYHKQGAPALVNCTLHANTADLGGGISIDASYVTLTNCVLWANADGGGTGEDAQIHVHTGTVAINHSCVQGWTGAHGGTGNTGEDPRLVDADGPDGIPGTSDDDLRPASGSAAIDSADNLAVPPDVADLDDDGDTAERTPLDLAAAARFVNDPATADTGVPDPPDDPAVVDMGAYEYQPAPACVCGDLSVNGFVDLTDFATFAACYGLDDPSPDCAAPDLLCCDLNGDDFVNLTDFATFALIYGAPASGSPPDCQ